MQQEIFDYQALDRKLRAIERELNQSEDRVKGKKLGFLKHEAEDGLTRLNARSGELQRLVSGIEKESASLQATVTEYEKAFAESEDAEELAYLKKKITTIYDRVVSLQRECGSLLSESEDIVGKSNELCKRLPVIVDQLNKCKVAFDGVMKSKQPEVAEIKLQMTALEAKIAPDTLALYKTVKAQNIFPVFVKLNDKRCGGCQMELPPLTLEKINTQAYVRCEHCNRIVVK